MWAQNIFRYICGYSQFILSISVAWIWPIYFLNICCYGQSIFHKSVVMTYLISIFNLSFVMANSFQGNSFRCEHKIFSDISVVIANLFWVYLWYGYGQSIFNISVFMANLCLIYLWIQYAWGQSSHYWGARYGNIDSQFHSSQSVFSRGEYMERGALEIKRVFSIFCTCKIIVLLKSVPSVFRE